MKTQQNKKKWMYAFFDKDTSFWGITENKKRVKMMIRGGTLLMIKEAGK